jgi:hypothetical protein
VEKKPMFAEKIFALGMLVNRVFTEINFEDEVITFQCNAT